MSDLKQCSPELRAKIAREIKAERVKQKEKHKIEVKRAEIKKRSDEVMFQREIEKINAMEL